MSSQPQFAAPADGYDRFMGRYSRELAPVFVKAAHIVGDVPRVLDVGCGPGALSVSLAAEYGGSRVAAIDPAEQFVAACRERVPGVDARVGGAESLPWDDDTFDAALACLVLGFMRDPVLGVNEMVRVTRPGGVVAACFWSLPGGMEMLTTFWRAFAKVTGKGPSDAGLLGSAQGDIARSLEAAGLADITEDLIEVRAAYSGFDDYWEPMTFGVGPAGVALAELDEPARAAVREACRAALPSDGPFTLLASAWFARGLVT